MHCNRQHAVNNVLAVCRGWHETHLGGACSCVRFFALSSAASAFWRRSSRSVLFMRLRAACACRCLALPARFTRQLSAVALHCDMLLYVFVLHPAYCQLNLKESRA